MNLGIRTLLTDILDYAGLFPPAVLEFDDAVRKFAAYRRCPESFMLGRFVCPIDKLSLAEHYLDELFREEPLRLSLVGRGGDSLDAWCTGLAAGCRAAREFAARAGSRVRIEAYEVRLPPEILGAEAETALPVWAERIAAAAQLEECRFYFEIGLGSDWRVGVPRAVSCVRQLSTRFALPVAGVKLRCGGIEPAAFPSAEQVAVMIATCRDLQTPLKFTAGLHHPTPRYDAGVRARMHGFLNVFLAGILAHTLHLDAPDILAIVEEHDARHFHFSNEFVGWSQAEATISEVQYARRGAAISFGSCSFDEPRADLRELGLLG